jgi:hypothetical protein
MGTSTRAKVTAELTITSDTLTPEDVADHLRLPYDRCWRIGDPRGSTGKAWANYGWVLSVTKLAERAEDVPGLVVSCLEDLVRRIGPIAESARAISGQSDIGVSVDVLASTVPALMLERDVVRVIAEAGAWLDIDINLWDAPDQLAGA